MATTAIIILLTAILAVFAAPSIDPRAQFDAFRAQYHRSYHGAELEHRFAVFRANLALIKELNTKYLADGISTVRLLRCY